MTLDEIKAVLKRRTTMDLSWCARAWCGGYPTGVLVEWIR